MPPSSFTPSLNPTVSTFRNALATHKSHFPLPKAPLLAQVPRYPINSLSKSLFLKTQYEPFAGQFNELTGAVTNLRAGSLPSVYHGIFWKMLMLGYAVRFEPKCGTYINWPHKV
jgi:hypothetical protein